MSDQFEKFARTVLVKYLYITLWSSHGHVEHLHVKLGDLFNQRLEVFKFHRTHENTDTVLVRLKIALAILVVDFSVDNPVERYQSQSVNARGIKF